jgi:hypothetical protein
MEIEKEMNIIRKILKEEDVPCVKALYFCLICIETMGAISDKFQEGFHEEGMRIFPETYLERMKTIVILSNWVSKVFHEKDLLKEIFKEREKENAD